MRFTVLEHEPSHVRPEEIDERRVRVREEAPRRLTTMGLGLLGGVFIGVVHVMDSESRHLVHIMPFMFMAKDNTTIDAGYQVPYTPVPAPTTSCGVSTMSMIATPIYSNGNPLAGGTAANKDAFVWFNQND